MRTRGFSLSELLISLMILSVLSVLLVGVIPATVNGMRGAVQRSYASSMARQAVEEALRDGFERLQNRTLKKIFINGTEFEGDLQVVDATAPDGSTMDKTRARQVTVTVRWNFHGAPKSYSTARLVVKQI